MVSAGLRVPPAHCKKKDSNNSAEFLTYSKLIISNMIHDHYL